MMEILVLGQGCAACQTAYQRIASLIESTGAKAQVHKVEDFVQMMQYPITATPGFVVNGQVVLFGRIPAEAEVRAWLDGSINPSKEGGRGCCS